MEKRKHILSMLLLVASCLFSANVFAEAVEIDGIYYNLVTKAKQAEVTYNPSKYSGTIRIPGTVTYNGVTYSVTSIEIGAFAGCRGLTSVSIPNSVISIGVAAFQGCSGLKKVVVPDIAAWCGIAFEDYESNPLYYAKHLYSDETTEITNLIIPNSVTSVGCRAFHGCSGLTSVTIGNSVTSIGYSAFDSCTGLTSVTIPNSVTSIGEYAFEDCSSLTSVTIGNSVTSIGSSAFERCYSLTSVSIGNSVTSIGWCAFQECSGLTSVTIPNSVTSIGYSAFERCYSLTSVSIGNSVTSIGYSAFRYCSGLTSITIPNSVTVIGAGAFYGCSDLTTVNIGNSVENIYSETFAYCSGLTSVNIGNGVKNIWDEAFANCAELSDVYCYAEKVPSTESDAFADSYTEYATLHVPTASVEQYKATAPWSNFGTIVATDGTIPEPPTPEKCATPTISYSKGELTFSCNTEGAEFISEIKDADIKKHYTASVSLTATYNISVYATKANYENSDTIQATLCWIEQQPQTEGITDEDAITEVQAVPVLIQTQGNTITVEGAEAGTEIILYGMNGVQLDSVIATTGVASLNASRLSGSVAIVKIGNKTVKVLVKQ